MLDSEVESIVMQLIAYAGDVRSLSYEAINKAKSFEFELAKALIEKAENQLSKAQEYHLNLLNIKDLNILIVHAQDHLNAATIEIEFAKHLIDLYKRLSKYEKSNI